MCLENIAKVSETYVNKQVEGLYEIAKGCFEKHKDKPAHSWSSQARYEIALYNFHGREKEQLQHVKFGLPKITFLCNHELVITLKVKEYTLLQAHQ